jgi:hypothetical protein
MASGSLTIVGTGIRLDQVSLAARACLENADKVLYLVADPVTASWITDLNPSAESMFGYYHPDKPRMTTYLQMVERILSCVRQGLEVCGAFYGHPGVFVYPAHEAIRRARREGYTAQMLPGISAEDCLFADLGVDPGRSGCQSFEATDFLIYQRQIDTGSSLILWQISVIGDFGCKTPYNARGLEVLAQVLVGHYGPHHSAVVYEAALYPVCQPVIQRVTLRGLPQARVTPASTLYVPPKKTVAPDRKMLERLGIPFRSVGRKGPLASSNGVARKRRRRHRAS